MDIHRADLPLLISLDVLLAERNVTRAARRLHLSQPALSGQLARLREWFGDPLLVPSDTGRGMVPTERALALQPRLAEALRALREAVAQDAAFDPRTSERTFVIAANDNVLSILALRVMDDLIRDGNPALRLAIVPPTAPDLMDRMAAGEVDLVLGDVSGLPGSLKARALLSDTFGFAQRKQHPRGMTAPSLDEYCALPHVVVSSRAEFSTAVDDALAELACERRVAIAVPSYAQVAVVLSQTDGVATLPRQLLRRFASLVDVFDVPLPLPPFEMAMAWHPRAHQDPAAQWLRARVLAAAETLAGTGAPPTV